MCLSFPGCALRSDSWRGNRDIAVAIIAVVAAALGTNLNTTFSTVSTVAEITSVRSGARPKTAVNDRSTSVRHHRGSVGVGRTMGRLPASERPRSCSLGTGPFAFFGLALPTFSAPSTFARHINGLRRHLAPAASHAAKIAGAPAEQMPARRHPETTTLSKAVRGAARSFLCLHG